MKQGRADKSGSRGGKVEPNPHAVSKSYPGQLGAHFGNHSMEGDSPRTAHVKMYDGRGYEAPMSGKQIHPAGSQGKHR